MLGLIRRPIDLALSLAEAALDASLGVVRAVRSFVEDDQASTRWDVAEPAGATGPAGEAAAPGGASRTHTARAPETVAPAPAPPVEDHVSEEPVPVAEFAEPGAEDGASAEVTVEEPWEGYSRQDARTIVGQLASANREALAAVDLYESRHRKRRSVLAAAEDRLRELSGPAATKNR